MEKGIKINSGKHLFNDSHRVWLTRVSTRDCQGIRVIRVIRLLGSLGLLGLLGLLVPESTPRILEDQPMDTNGVE
jgi:hypothetical protein